MTLTTLAKKDKEEVLDQINQEIRLACIQAAVLSVGYYVVKQFVKTEKEKKVKIK